MENKIEDFKTFQNMQQASNICSAPVTFLAFTLPEIKMLCRALDWYDCNFELTFKAEDIKRALFDQLFRALKSLKSLEDKSI